MPEKEQNHTGDKGGRNKNRGRQEGGPSFSWQKHLWLPVFTEQLQSITLLDALVASCV